MSAIGVSTSQPVPHATRQAALQTVLAQRAPQMELAPLLRVLHGMGYRTETILFRSQITTLHQPSLVQSIEFCTARSSAAAPGSGRVAENALPSSQDAPIDLVYLTLNIGFLATQSPLPSYVFRDLATQHGNTLSAFLEFCAHHLLRQVVDSQVPALAVAPPGLLAAQQQTLTLLGLTTPSTWHWLLGHAFPELAVEVTRGTQRILIQAQEVTVGTTTFGDGSAFGAQSAVLVPSLCVRLGADTPHCGTGEPWSREVPTRLAAWLWPLFISRRLYVEVELIVREASDVLTLGSAAQLGLQPFPSHLDPLPARRMQIFRGDVGQALSQPSHRGSCTQIGGLP